MGKFVEHFKETYYDKLITPVGNNPVRNRAESLLKVFELLEERAAMYAFPHFYPYKILETGCMRRDHGDFNFAGDGCSSIIFDDFVHFIGGGAEFYSIDINPDNTAYTKKFMKSSRTTILTCDSVTGISSLPLLRGLDLAHLDSYDVERHNPHPSALHHLMELTAVLPHMRKNGIIVVDDADAFFDGGKTGKAMYIREFMDKIGKKPVFDGYQLVYQL